MPGVEGQCEDEMRVCGDACHCSWDCRNGVVSFQFGASQEVDIPFQIDEN